MSKSSKGILKSKPRYSTAPDVNPPVSVRAPNIVSHEWHGDASSNDVTTVTMNSRDVVERFHTGNNQNSVSSSSSPSRDENHLARESKKNTRSLADLVRCSVNLSNEARGIVNNDEGSEHQPKKNNGVDLEEKLETLSLNHGQREMKGNVPIAISNSSSDLATPPEEGPAVVYIDSANFKLVTNDKNQRILLEESDEGKKETPRGRVDDIADNTEHVVRFSEYEDAGEDTAAHATTTRERLEQRVADHGNIEFDDYVDDDVGNTFNEDEKKGQDSDTDSTSSGGSTEDEEILSELGLSELISVNNTYDDDDILFSLNGSQYGEENAAVEPEPRSFRVIWETLSQWLTPSSIQLVQQYQEEHERGEKKSNNTLQPFPSKYPGENNATDDPNVRNSVDVGASRRAGIMSMLKLNVARSLSELKKINKAQNEGNRDPIAPTSLQSPVPPPGGKGKARKHSKPKIALLTDSDFSSTPSIKTEVNFIDQRQVEQRLADLIRTFDSSGPAANLNMKLWRGMTTVLIVIAFPVFGEISVVKGDNRQAEPTSNDANKDTLPPSVGSLGMTLDEFRYLTRSAFVSLG